MGKYTALAVVAACVIFAAAVAGTKAIPTASATIGQPADERTIERENIDVAPDGAGLPGGSGEAARGRAIFAAACMQCHGTSVVLLPERWAYATTIFDYVRRAMPPTTTTKLSADEVYAVVAYLLASNAVISEHEIMNASSLPLVHMPLQAKFLFAR